MKENWEKRKSFPPHYVDVLHRRNQGSEEIIFAKGKMPHLGYPHEGWSGDETVIFRRKNKNGEWKVVRKEPRDYKKAVLPPSPFIN